MTNKNTRQNKTSRGKQYCTVTHLANETDRQTDRLQQCLIPPTVGWVGGGEGYEETLVSGLGGVR